MYVVIFRAKVRTLDDEYFRVAARMRELALTQFGCVEFQSVSEGNDEISLSYWADEASILAWKKHAEHVIAQQLGCERWYDFYFLEIVAITRRYQYPMA